MVDSRRIPSLPVELLINVASNLTKGASLCSLALVNTTFNYAATPILYAAIALDNPNATRKCLDTLNLPSALCSFQRDLPPSIRSFVVDWGVWHDDEDSDNSDVISLDGILISDIADGQAQLDMPTSCGVPVNGFRAALEKASLRMCNLRRFYCWESFMFTPKAFSRLVAGPAASSLREVGGTMEDWRLPPHGLSLEDVSPTCTHLWKVHFILPSRQLDWANCMGYVGHLLKASATHLESLALDLSSFCTDLHAAELFSGISSFRALEVLRLPAATDLSLIPCGPSLRCLQLDRDYSREGHDGVTRMRSLPSSFFSRLEQLYCSHIDLPTFLPADTDTPRPIHAVFLDGAVYDLAGRTGGNNLAPLSLLPSSSLRLEVILRCLPNSPVPVTELNLYLERVDVVALREILPFIRHLEQFIIITGHRPRNLRRAHLLGKTVFAHMPHLHTFLLCTTEQARSHPTPLHSGYGSYFYEQQEACLRAFDKYAPWLQRVMLTTGLEWIKQADGTWDTVEVQGF